MFVYRGSIIIRYSLKALTGLRVGGSKENFEIGGLDNPVIKTLSVIEKYDGEHDLPEGAPYIPGSSLKGKIRSLLEWVRGRVEYMVGKADGNVDKAGEPCNCGSCEVCKVFGTGKLEREERESFEGRSVNEIPGPPRLRVFDAYPTWETIDKLNELLGEGIYTEIKTENAINRLTSRANPRKVERVPAGALFFGEMAFHMFAKEDEKLLKLVSEGMKLLEDDYLGGYGSRGSGKVRFERLELVFRPKEYYSGEQEEDKLGVFSSVQEVLKGFSSIEAKLKNA